MAEEQQSRAYLQDLATGEIHYFQKGLARLTHNRQAGIKASSIPGLDHERLVAANAGSEDVSFSLVYVATDSAGRGFDKQAVVRAQAFLLSMTVPRVINQEPGHTGLVPGFLVIGEFLELPVYVKEVNTDWGPFDGSEGLLPVMAKVNVRCTVAPTSAFVGALAMRSGASVKRSLIFNVGGV